MTTVSPLRKLGLLAQHLPCGPHNALTDVPGVRVGHCTVSHGEGALRPGTGPARTGVTAIVPCDDPWNFRLPSSAFVLNGNGEMAGLAYIQDVGTLEVPILLTNTLNVGKVADASISWLIGRHPAIGISDDVPIAVVGECDDSTLNDIQGRHVQPEHVWQALDEARSGPVVQGAVGAGTGMIAYDFKAGIGTASRRLPQGYTVGVLVNANHGHRQELRIDGRALLLPEVPLPLRKTEGSIIIVVATDAPLSCLQLQRLARRAAMGLARTGSCAHHGSGDLILAFSTANGLPRGWKGPRNWTLLPDQELDGLYRAAVEATEESVLNSLWWAETCVGRDGNTAWALPHEALSAPGF